MCANVSSYQRNIFDISNWQANFVISHGMRYFYGRIEWPDLWPVSTEAARHLFRRIKVVSDEVSSEKFVKIIVCGWIIYAIWNRINYLRCVNVRPILKGICYFSVSNCSTNSTPYHVVSLSRTFTESNLESSRRIDLHEIKAWMAASESFPIKIKCTTLLFII